jgi:hypothetical protein
MAKYGTFKYGLKKYGYSIQSIVNLLAEFEINQLLLGEIDTSIELEGSVNVATKNQNFTMYSGDTKILNFTVTMTGVLTGSTIKWVLGKGSTIYITKTTISGINISGDKTFTVTINPVDTASLYGTYLHEAEITDADGNVSTVAIGKVVITKDIAI